MPRMSKSKKLEWSFFLTDRGRKAYNTLCRRFNSTGHFYDADVAELKERMADVWELLKVQQRNEL